MESTAPGRDTAEPTQGEVGTVRGGTGPSRLTPSCSTLKVILHVGEEASPGSLQRTCSTKSQSGKSRPLDKTYVPAARSPCFALDMCLYKTALGKNTKKGSKYILRGG